jgi:hypothetical protein
MNERDDLAERALGALARQEELEAPDAGLETVLRARHEKRRRGLRRFLMPGLVVASLTGAAYAGGWELVRRWWYSIEVAGTVSQGVHQGDGTRVFHVEPESGGTATVRVSSEGIGAAGVRTRIELDRQAPGFEEHEVAEDVVDGVPPERIPSNRIAGLEPLYRFESAQGPNVLYLLDEADPRLLLHQEQALPDSLLVLERLPLEALSEEAQFVFAVTEEGALELTLTLPDGIERGFAWSTDPGARRAGGSLLETDDGQIRVRVQNDPDPQERR